MVDLTNCTLSAQSDAEIMNLTVYDELAALLEGNKDPAVEESVILVMNHLDMNFTSDSGEVLSAATILSAYMNIDVPDIKAITAICKVMSDAIKLIQLKA